MEHKTGTFAELWGLSPEGLKFYIKKGLIDPESLGKYRVYSYREASILHRLLYFRSYGFSLDEARRLCYVGQRSEVLRQLKDKNAEIQKEIKQKQALLEQLNHDIQFLDQAEEQLNEITVKKMPAVCAVAGSLEDGSRDTELFSDWVRYLPFVQTNYVVDLNDQNSYDVRWGITAPLSLYEDLSQQIGQNEIQIFGGCLCLHSMIKDHDNKGIDPRILEPLLAYAKRHNYQIKGYALINFTFILQPEKDAEKSRYLECFIPIGSSEIKK